MNRTLLLFLIGTLVPIPALAQSDDIAYCAALSDLARRYPSDTARGRPVLDSTASLAIDNCQKGNTAAAIPVLEQKLRNGGFTLPKRS